MNDTTETRCGIDVEVSLLLQVCECPTEFDRFLILADWYEEQGDDVAADCWRWLASVKVYPSHEPDVSCESGDGTSLTFWWNDCARELRIPTPRHSHLPRLLLEAMPPDQSRWKYTEGDCLCYETRRDAFRDAITGWRSLTTEQRQECWGWEP